MAWHLGLIFLSSLLALWLGRYPRAKYLLLLPLLYVFSQLYTKYLALDGVPAIEAFRPAASSFGWRFSLVLDDLSLFLSMIILGIGICVQLYTLGYFSKPKDTARFSSHLLLFMGAMLGVVLSNNLLLLFVFWELTSVSSYMMIAFKHEKPEARSAALQALLVTGVGGLCLLAGILLVGAEAGSFEISEIALLPSAFLESPAITIALSLIFIGALTKSAQFPFHFWLPNAMQAPTPASSYLHSATMVKAGVFLLFRLAPIFSTHPMWTPVLSTLGCLTLLIACLLALLQFDLKKVLAYTTLSALGTLIMLIGVGSYLALYAALAFTLAHALYKAPMFLLVGNIDHECGTRDLRQLSGVGKLMPKTFVITSICALALASLPPLFSFVAKETVLKALMGSPALWLTVGFSGAVFVFISCLFIFHVFAGKTTGNKGHEAPWQMLLAPGALAAASILVSVLPLGLSERLISGAAKVVSPYVSSDFYLTLWHGFNLPLAISVLGIVLGIVFYKQWHRLREPIEDLGAKITWGPSKIYDFCYYAVMNYPKPFFRFVQHGFLNYYLIVLVLFLLLLMRMGLAGSEVSVYWDFGDLNLFEIVMAFAIMGGAVLALRSESALAALTAMGLVGFGIAFLFLINGAPDLALTQFLVETLTLVLLVLSFRVLPKTQEKSGTPYSLFVAGVSGFFALGISYVSLYASQTPARAVIRDYFGEYSYVIAKGKNVVNVILVDFRGLDTLGEIVVLCIAAVGVYTLLRFGKKEVA